MSLQEKIITQLKSVLDPELNLNVVDLGLIYGVDISENNDVNITMTLTTPGCPLHDSISGGVKSAVTNIPEVNSVQVQVVWQPAWSPTRISPEGKRVLGFQ